MSLALAVPKQWALLRTRSAARDVGITYSGGAIEEVFFADAEHARTWSSTLGAKSAVFGIAAAVRTGGQGLISSGCADPCLHLLAGPRCG